MSRRKCPTISNGRNAEGRDERPQVGDELLAVGGINLAGGNYADYIRAMRSLSRHVGETVEVRWQDPVSGQVHEARAKVDYPPTRSYVWSCLWFLQELLIFAIGARVFWKRPRGRLGPALLLALHRHRRRVHGGLSLDGDRAPSGA